MLTAIKVVTIQNDYIINYIPYALGYFNFQDRGSLSVPFLPLGGLPQVVAHTKSAPGTLPGIRHPLSKPTLKGLGIFNWKNHQIRPWIINEEQL